MSAPTDWQVKIATDEIVERPLRHGVSLVFDRDLPAEVRGAAEALVRKHIQLVPMWLIDLRIDWRNNSEKNGAAETCTWFEYRRANITLLPGFLDYPSYRETVIVHELLHIVLTPLVDIARIASSVLEEKGENTVSKMLSTNRIDSMEGVVCDLTEIFMRCVRVE